MKVIRRGKVHVIDNEQNKIFSITEENRVKVNIRQIELHVIDGICSKFVKEHYMEGPMEMMGFKMKAGTLVPGNIHIVQQTEPWNEYDLMEGLLWKDGRVIRTKQGEAVYEIKWYSEQEKFEPEKDFDTFLLSL